MPHYLWSIRFSVPSFTKSTPNIDETVNRTRQTFEITKKRMENLSSSLNHDVVEPSASDSVEYLSITLVVMLIGFVTLLSAICFSYFFFLRNGRNNNRGGGSSSSNDRAIVIDAPEMADVVLNSCIDLAASMACRISEGSMKVVSIVATAESVATFVRRQHRVLNDDSVDEELVSSSHSWLDKMTRGGHQLQIALQLRPTTPTAFAACQKAMHALETHMRQQFADDLLSVHSLASRWGCSVGRVNDVLKLSKKEQHNLTSSCGGGQQQSLGTNVHNDDEHNVSQSQGVLSLLFLVRPLHVGET